MSLAVSHISRAKNVAGVPIGFVVTLSCGHQTLTGFDALPVLTFAKVGLCQMCSWYKDV